MSSTGACPHFARGNCTYGLKCKFRHDPTAQENGPDVNVPKKTRLCNNFSTPAGCRYGESCRFSHNKSAIDSATTSSATNANSSDRVELHQWRYGIPTSLDRARPMAEHNLKRFFKNASDLVTRDDETRQTVIERLVSEGGLYRLNEMIELFKFADGFESSIPSLVLELFLPFCRIFSIKEVRNTFAMEDHVHRLINWFSSPTRSMPLFAATVGVLVEIFPETGLYPQSDDPTLQHLESFVAFFNITAKLVSSARANPELKQLLETLMAAVEPHNLNTSSSGVKAQGYLEQLQRMMNIEPRTATQKSLEHAATEKPLFRLRQDGPGLLSTEGRRHDNDDENICQINLMPTDSEVHSSRSEYLPLADPRELHLPGVAGLIDRQFRLLREDTVGQLRDAVRVEIQRQAPNGRSTLRPNEQHGLRTHVYRNGRLLDLRVNWRSGLEFLYCFEQEPKLQLASPEERKRWWESSKRLQPEALVCLVDPTNAVLFATVVDLESQNKKARPNAASIPQYNLHSDERFAYVGLVLVELKKSTMDLLFRRMEQQDAHADTLVEFPGVLLASFFPTLKALQEMSRTLDMPFAHLIASSQTVVAHVDIAPPAYAVETGFSYDLGSIISPGEKLHLRVDKQFDVTALQNRSTLDSAQAQAVVYALSNSFAIIQGPPGTGKSYTGGRLIKVLLGNQKQAELGPIICVTYTNHAVDQLLEHLIHDGVDQIIRIGSRSKSELLENLTLRAVRDRVQSTGPEKHQRYQLTESIKKDGKKLSDLTEDRRQVGSIESYDKYLLAQHPRHHRELFGVKDQEGWTEVRRRQGGRFLDWYHNIRNEAPISTRQVRPPNQLARVSLWSMTMPERYSMLRYWFSDMLADIDADIASITDAFVATKRKRDILDSELDLRALKQAKVIGVTTSGLARIVGLLSKLESKVLICEEAGEVLEAHSLTTLLPSVQHSILIGDHLQLRPSIQNYDLQRDNPRGKQYSLDVSLFERLVDPQDGANGAVPFVTLETQRRMHPSIAELVRSTLYPKLRDFENVQQYPAVSGMKNRLFWLDHNNPEDGKKNEEHLTTSHSNSWEVEMVAALISHLVKQGTYNSSDIAVLTPYGAQIKKLRSRLSQSFEVVVDERDLQVLEAQGLQDEEGDDEKGPNPSTTRQANLLSTVRVATIDNFQGEEAKVVLISLVRSNSERITGFLKTKNRINVTLSRAQHGMYIIGNSHTARSAPMWDQVCHILEEEGNIGPVLSLQCPRHEDTQIPIASPDDILLSAPEGGCSLPCGQRLACGHSCPSACHSQHLHDSFSCPEDCPRSLKGCDHSCPKKCGDSCPDRCRVNIQDVELPCGHTQTLDCYEAQDLETAECRVKVSKRMQVCQHEITITCHDRDSKEIRCSAKCGKSLPCGHECKRTCSSCTRVNIETGSVISEDHGDCKQPCGMPFTTCRHSCKKICHPTETCELCQSPCEVQCAHSICSRKCSEPCAPCAESSCDNSCPHSSCPMPCSAPCNSVPCSRRCSKVLECGHQCPSLCSEACPTKEFCQICADKAVKETRADLIMYEQYLEIDLDRNPCIFLPCRHIFTVESLDGQMAMSKHYKLDQDGAPTGLQSSSQPFSVEELKVCPDCRGSLRSVRRYGRIVRRTLLDESTKKFILWANSAYVKLSEKMYALEDESALSLLAAQVSRNTFAHSLDLTGTRDQQIRVLSGERSLRVFIAKFLKLRTDIAAYGKKVRAEEQPFQRVRELVQHTRRQGGNAGQFDFDGTILQTRSYILAFALLLRCDLDILSNIVNAYIEAPKHAGQSTIDISLVANMDDCETLVGIANEGKQHRQEIEAHILCARFAALERSMAGMSTATAVNGDVREDEQAEPARSGDLRDQGIRHVDMAELLCDIYPGSAAGMEAEIENVRKMLRDSTFYAPVTGEETREILRVMATELQGTGHWYLCENGHPFTIGECGMPMETSRCPQCGAAVGGQNHQNVAGVARAEELDRMLRDMHI